jgi:hypothetical protein
MHGLETGTLLPRIGGAARALVLISVVAGFVGARTASAQSPRSAAKTDVAGEREVGNYRLTVDKVEKYFAAMESAARAAKGKPEADEKEPEDASEWTLEQWVAEYERDPVARREITKAGLSVREFAVLGFAMMTAGAANLILSMQPKADVDSLARELSANPATLRANLRFIRENEARLTAKRKALEAPAPPR